MEMILVTTAAVLVPILGLLFDMKTTRVFSLRAFVSTLMLLEYGGQALKLSFRTGFILDFYYAGEFTRDYAAPAIWLGLLAYVLFFVAYSAVAPLFRRNVAARDRASETFFRLHWSPLTRLCLMGATTLSIIVGFVQDYQRVRAAGGLARFILNAYQFRVGTSTEGAAGNAVVGLSNVIGGLAMGFIVVWTIAWAAKKLVWQDKLFVLFAGFFLLARQAAAMARSMVIFTIVGITGAWLTQRRVPFRKIVAVGLVLVIILLGVNWIHQYMYYLTAGWNLMGFTDATGALLAAQGHVWTFGHELYTLDYGGQPLHGRGLLESVLFFVPRVLWHNKAPIDQYGTTLVQGWANLPTSSQMAITLPGELYVHFGYYGMLGMLLFGAFYGALDSWAFRNPVLQSAFYGMLLSRVLVDMGMGVSAFSITLFECALFVAICWVTIYMGDALDSVVSSVGWRFGRKRTGGHLSQNAAAVLNKVP
jgi:hypothetical protein